MAEQILVDGIERADLWLREWGKLVGDVSIANEQRQHASAAFQHLGLEHHVAILRLVHAEIYGSAFALFRSQFDAFTRGAWLRVCASDAWIEKFLRGDSRPSDLKELIEGLEAAGAYEPGHLSGFRDKAYALLCDYTHGGSVQLRSRMGDGSIAQGWEHKQVSGLLTSSCGLSLLGLLELAKLSDTPDELARKLGEAHMNIFMRT
ncbi:DUF6988 family protein [Burkholderia seminalis]|uniref:DUF6988 family protein n=1 Tax=Burkholderia seminalis TaxID=488731 RepID=UPI002651695F|nr:hypothetical protein [Burkholderia seminalis]MDN7851320.1 hypothetical protein [Burkholderia seminalis]